MHTTGRGNLILSTELRKLRSLKDFMDTHCIGYILKYDMLFLYDPFKIITTDGLLNTLKLHGRTCTMVDAAHGFTKYEKVKLTALFVRSLRGEGIAVANSRQTTIEIYKRFIAHLIEWMGPIETAIFMANMDKKESVGIVRKQYWRRSSLSVARANSLDHQQIKNDWKLSRKWRHPGGEIHFTAFMQHLSEKRTR